MADLVTRTQAAPVVLGAIAFGKPKATTRDHPLATDDSCNDLLRAFAELGGEELDTARLYQNGQSEAAIGRLPASAVIRVGTKYHPTLDGGPVTQMEQSLAALQRDSVSICSTNMDVYPQVSGPYVPKTGAFPPKFPYFYPRNTSRRTRSRPAGSSANIPAPAAVLWSSHASKASAFRGPRRRRLRMCVGYVLMGSAVRDSSLRSARDGVTPVSHRVLNHGELHRWLQVNGHDDRCQHMQPTDGGVQYGSEAEFG